MGPHALARRWIDKNKILVEKKVFALCLLMAIVQKPHPHLPGSQDPLLKASSFNEVMLWNRFCYSVLLAIVIMMQMTLIVIDCTRFMLQKNILINSNVFVSKKFVSIDEELLLWKVKSHSSSTYQLRDLVLVLNFFVFAKGQDISVIYLLT